MPRYDFLISSNKNSIDYNVQPQIELDQSRKWVMGIRTFSAFNTTNNLSAAKGNNTLKFSVGASNYTLTIPDGLYNVAGIGNAVIEGVTNLGLAYDLMIINPNVNTGHSIVQLNSASLSIQWTTSGIAPLLGFTTNTPTGPAGRYVTSDTIAGVGSITEYVVHCANVLGFLAGTSGTLKYGDILANVPITAPISQQFVQESYHIQWRYFNLTKIDTLSFYITDQNGVLLEVNDEWTASIIICPEDEATI